MHLRFTRKTDSLYHRCLKERLFILAFALAVPALLSAQSIRFRDVTTEMKVPGWVVSWSQRIRPWLGLGGCLRRFAA